MPTAIPAVPSRSQRVSAQRARRHVQRFAVSGLGVIIALGSLFAAESISAPGVAASARPSCQGWTSTTQPPAYIRVLRRHTGRVQRVPFRKYVVTVMGKEWPSYLPQQVINAGAVAVKQYAWYHALGHGRMSRRGQCYDVTDGTGDQLYKPGRARVRADHYTAINQTWDVRLLKNGNLFMTGYRTGSKHRCGADRTGWKLYARSAVRCANKGMNFLQILRTYYGPVSVVGRYGQPANGNSTSSGGSTAAAVATTSALTIDLGPATAQPDGGQTGGVTVDASPATVAPTVTSTEVSQNAFTAG